MYFDWLINPLTSQRVTLTENEKLALGNFLPRKLSVANVKPIKKENMLISVNKIIDDG
jgi:hypothetical protein